MEIVEQMSKTDKEWRATLTTEQYTVLREKGTERPYSGMFDRHIEKGIYTCAGCGTTLFSSQDKFDAGCGWPSFSDSEEGKVKTERDMSLGMVRTEIVCANCGGHLGHVFDDGPTETKQRYCVNSLSLDFTPREGTANKNEEKERD
ncbi:MAG: peptide-methionine (R)-S-oxide reductase MsrB [Flavobacteriales bacterium]|nr:peptide-methionine (R)-S-oxide reductase MsrB [Flavobacteriales bacterium]